MGALESREMNSMTKAISRKGVEWLMVDSGTFCHVCPPDFAAHVPVEPAEAEEAGSATGHTVAKYGEKPGHFADQDGVKLY